MKQEPDYKKARKLEKEADELVKKYNLNTKGDGNPGDGTPLSDKAGEKYLKLWDQIIDLDDSADDRAYEKVKKIIDEKYGNIAIKQLQDQDTARGRAAVAATIGLMVAGTWAVFHSDT